MSRVYHFNEKETEYILNNYKEYTNQELADVIGCTKRQIERLLRSNGIKKGKSVPHRKQRIFSMEDDNFIKLNYHNMTSIEIGNVLGYSKHQIDGRVQKLGLRKNRVINDSYFSIIDSSLKAYYLGFIFADGWIIYNEEKRIYELGMQLQSQDCYVLEKLNFELGNQNIIYHKPSEKMILNNHFITRGDSDVLRIYSKQLTSDLINLGIVPNKSQKNIYPKIDGVYFWDFLRGYIDGDGCYYKNNNQVYMHITSASVEVLQYIQSKLALYNIDTRLYCENSKKYRLMCVNTKEMCKLVNRLYYKDDLFYLTRKYEKIKHFLGSAA